MGLGLNEGLGRTFAGEADDKRRPQPHKQQEASSESRKPLHDTVVRAVDEAVKATESYVRPSTCDQPERYVVRTDGNGDKRVEEDRRLKQVSEIIGSLYVL